MRRVLLPIGMVLAACLLLPGTVSAGGPEVRWLVYTAGVTDAETGALMAVRSDGRGNRSLISGSVTAADVGSDRTAYVVLRQGDERYGLGRLSIARGKLEEVPSGAETGFLLGIAVSAEDDVAFQRFVDVSSRVPRHLEDALPSLVRARMQILVPPRRPPGTTGTVADSTRRSYDLLFTNDPEGELAHAEQINVFVDGTTRPFQPPPDATPVGVRGTTGSFSCGASTCFLDWEEGGATYSVGEFGSPDQAVGFAESLRPIEDVAGPDWRAPVAFRAPQLVVLRNGRETILESVEEFCECSFRPADWDDTGSRLLVTTSAESFTSLMEYGGTGEPATLEEGTDGAILDAAYGPDGPLVLVAPGFGPEGDVRPVGGGEALVEGAHAFDVEGSTLAWVTEDGAVMVRDLETGDERRVASGATSVSVSPETVQARATPSPPVFPEPPESEGFPFLLVGALAVAGAALIAGTVLLYRARRGR